MKTTNYKLGQEVRFYDFSTGKTIETTGIVSGFAGNNISVKCDGQTKNVPQSQII